MRTSTNAGLAGGLAVIVIFILTAFVPEVMDRAPPGLEAALTAVIMYVVARLSKTPAQPGLF